MTSLLDDSPAIVRRGASGRATSASARGAGNRRGARLRSRIARGLLSSVRVAGLFLVALLANVVVGLVAVVAVAALGYYAVIAVLAVFG